MVVRLRNTKNTYGSIARMFHWAMAFLILSLILVGLYMGSIPYSPFKLEVYAYHKSFGLLVLWLVGLRLVWRSVNQKPSPYSNHQKWEKILAKLAHVFLYGAMIGMPLSGWLMSSAGQYPVPFFGFQMPDLVGQSSYIAKLMGSVHEVLAYALVIGIGLHAAGAFKHHFFDKDTTLIRMMANPMKKIGPYILTAIMILFALSVLKLEFFPNKQQEKKSVVEESLENAKPHINIKSNNVWDITEGQSDINFTSKVYGKEFTGSFNDFSGKIIFDPNNLKDAEVDITINLQSIDSKDEERDSQMQSEEWFHTDQYPEANFKASVFEKSGDGYLAKGVLSIKGNEVPIDLLYSLDINENNDQQRAIMKATITLNRLNFALGTGQWESSDTVAQDVVVGIDLMATRKIQ